MPSRQRAWQLVRQATGRCALCSTPRHLYRVLCDAHHFDKVARQQRRAGHTPWTPGGRGRIPLWAKRKEA